MPDQSKKRIRRATIIYWMLLIYIVAALVWWFISLINQNKQITDLKTTRLNTVVDKTKTPETYQSQVSQIHNEYERNVVKYIGEGSTFLLLTLIGAAFVYRSVRRQFRLQQQQQNFMMAITHELKTPISVAQLNLETLQKYQLDAEKQKKLIRMTLEETERLNILTNNILISSELETGGYRLAKEELDLSDLFKDCIRNFVQRFPERKFIEEIETDRDVKGDPLLLKLLINNLIDNAVKYSPKEKSVLCQLKKINDKIELHIIDEGSGISDEEKKKVFDKFYRIGNEATRKTQGTGLGLYLCRKIAADHNAGITVTNHLPAGSNFTVMFNPGNEN
jgi:signal transduction histidine kinase